MDTEQRTLVSERDVLRVCEECGCRNAHATLRQLSEQGFVLQHSGHQYRLGRKRSR